MFYKDKIGVIREAELKTVKKIAYVRWLSLLNQGSLTLLPGSHVLAYTAL